MKYNSTETTSGAGPFDQETRQAFINVLESLVETLKEGTVEPTYWAQSATFNDPDLSDYSFEIYISGKTVDGPAS